VTRTPQPDAGAGVGAPTAAVAAGLPAAAGARRDAPGRGILTNAASERVRSVRALAQRRVRARQGLFLAEGPPAVRAALRHRPDAVRDLYLTTEAATRHTGIVVAAAEAAVRVHQVSAEVLGAMCDTDTPQGLLAVCRVLTTDLATVLAARPRLLCVLTNVRDPGNAGTVVRAADAAGADAVILSDSSVDVWGPKVVRSSAGSLFHLPVVTGVPVEDILGQVRAAGLALLAADGAATQLLSDTDLDRPHAWVMGNEARGIDSAVRARCDESVRVPIHGRAESLNLAMAATLCLYASAQVRTGRA